MPISRGDMVVVAASGDYGKPRPAVVVQSNAIPQNHASVVIRPMTSELEADFRITVKATPETGLRVRSQVMADKPVTIRRERIGQRIGRLATADIARFNVALAFVIGLRINAQAIQQQPAEAGLLQSPSNPELCSEYAQTRLLRFSGDIRYLRVFLLAIRCGMGYLPILL
jgi:mRNA interferase MazF